MNHDLAWTAPPPFWTDPRGAVQDQLGQPQILRFATDDFMPSLLVQLEHDPASLPQLAVYKETWRGPAGAGPVAPSRWLEREPRRMADARRGALKRTRAAGGSQPAAVTERAPVLKLYQPAHLRHYLVAGSLVCRLPGLPDRGVDPARQKVGFVVRRLFPASMPAAGTPLPVPPDDLTGWDEHAFVLQGKAGAWRKVATDAAPRADLLVAGEERLAMFPAPFVQDDGHARRLYVGNVPVGRRETYQGAARATLASGGGTAAPVGMDPRIALFHTQVLAPWKQLLNRVMRVTTDPDPAVARPDFLFDASASVPGVPIRTTPLTSNGRKNLRGARGALQTTSWYLLLDLRTFLDQHLGAGFLDGGHPAGPLRDLFDALDDAAFTLASSTDDPADDGAGKPSLASDTIYAGADIETNLVDALRRIGPSAGQLENATSSFEVLESGTKPADWPTWLFLFGDPWYGAFVPPAPAGFSPPVRDYLVEKMQARIDSLEDLLREALPAPDATVPQPEPALATMQPADMREAWYTLRLVYERPDCAPFETTVVSAPTRPFQMAGFFDPDAPARPVRIGLPLDISPAGLRKFDKNTAFMMSDMLCGQIDRMKGIGLVDLVLSVLPWPLHKDLDVPSKGDCKTGSPEISLGVMCSLSIPIVTIAALILLMIIVSLLDFVFRWMPYLIACFPLPGFKGRKPEEP